MNVFWSSLGWMVACTTWEVLFSVHWTISSLDMKYSCFMQLRSKERMVWISRTNVQCQLVFHSKNNHRCVQVPVILCSMLCNTRVICRGVSFILSKCPGLTKMEEKNYGITVHNCLLALENNSSLIMKYLCILPLTFKILLLLLGLMLTHPTSHCLSYQSFC